MAFGLTLAMAIMRKRAEQIKLIRKAAKELEHPVAIVQDLHGPKMQLGDIEPTELNKGQEIQLAYYKDAPEGVLPTMYDIAKKVKKGERMYTFLMVRSAVRSPLFVAELLRLALKTTDL
jgi:pyruvate kinase